MVIPRFDWNRLREFNGSKQKAFEQLCCQLASQDSRIPRGSKFIRKGSPDAGVECYLVLPDGSEWGWQAKYFLQSPKAGEWRQIRNSFQTARDKHPHLTRYIICLPQNLADARVADDRTYKAKSALDKWNENTTKWKEESARLGREIEFELWGENELVERLTTNENKGRYWFWFDADLFGMDWFHKRFSEVQHLAEGKYIPDLDISLPIEERFHALGRTESFFNNIRKLYSEVLISFKKVHRFEEAQKLLKDDYHEKIIGLFKVVEPWISDDHDPDYYEDLLIGQIPWKDIDNQCREIKHLISSEQMILYDHRSALRKQDKHHKMISSYDSLIGNLHELENAIRQLGNFATSDSGRLSNTPFLFLLGSAGQGKTHLLAKTVQTDLDIGLPRILLFGEQFIEDDPWQTIKNILDLNCTVDEMLGALNASAQAIGSKLWIAIDALNEAMRPDIWSTHLPRMIVQISRYSWLGLCVSYRNEYSEVIKTNRIGENGYTKIEHRGFEGELSWKAMEKYFSHFQIEPSVPPLLPEFQNPLFLRLFCQALYNKKLHTIPKGLQGITSIFQFLVDSTNDVLAIRINYDHRINHVNSAVTEIANYLKDHNKRYIPLAITHQILDSILGSSGKNKSFLQELESENLVTIIPMTKNNKTEYFVKFTYERFFDHIIVKSIIREYYDKENPKGILDHIIHPKYGLYYSISMINALAIQLPEQDDGIELPMIINIEDNDSHLYIEAFIESLRWRSTESINDGTFNIINDYVIPYDDRFNVFLETVLMLSTIEDHPLNANRLDSYLRKYPMPKRDSWWIPFLYESTDPEDQVQRIVTWAWQDNSKTCYSDETVLLTGITLTWFLSASIRIIRDKATKALVRLFENRLGLLSSLLERFANIDDVYINERLYAVAFGCTMRSRTLDKIGPLAEKVYELVFKSGEPPCNVLLRDYARGVIEYAVANDVEVDLDIGKCRPPYRSEWPNMEVPNEDELKVWGNCEEVKDDREWAKHSIYSSVLGEFIADFSNYIIGDMRQWSSERLNEEHEPIGKEKFELFIDSLSDVQKVAWTNLQNVVKSNRENIFADLLLKVGSIEGDSEKIEFIDDLLTSDGLEENNDLVDEELSSISNYQANDEKFKEQEAKFINALEGEIDKQLVYKEFVIPYQKNPYAYNNENRFDGRLARRWIVQRVIELGWTVELMGKFDRHISQVHYERSGTGIERIGKKYQWIAYHELIARLSDNFRLRDESLNENEIAYNGPWDAGVSRDIDPSNLLHSGPKYCYGGYKKTWWFTEEYMDWFSLSDHMEWIEKVDDLPDPKNLINVEKNWICLTGSYKWQQPTPIGEETYVLPTRDITGHLKAYLVNKANLEPVVKWLKKCLWLGSLPDGFNSYEIMLGEYAWSPIYNDRTIPYYGYEGWTDGGRLGHTAPAELLVTHDEYFRDSGSMDYSNRDVYTIHLPCSLLVKGLGLKWVGEEGVYRDPRGVAVVKDPSVHEPGPGALLVNRDTLMEFLDHEDYGLIWTYYGEKRVIGREHVANGILKIYGHYYLKEGEIRGELRTVIEKWERRK